MFTIIGGDGREYGPVSADKIRGWLAAGRADLSTQAKAEGTVEWKPLGDYPEFSSGGEAAAAPPPLAGAAGELASPGERLGAWCIDFLVTFLSILPGALMVGPEVLNRVMHFELQDPDDLAPYLGGFMALFLGAMVVGILQAVLLTIRGQTLGKILCRVRIVRFRDGSNPGFLRAVLARSWLFGAVTSIPFVGSVIFLADSLFIFSRERRCLHDLVADTKVVRVPRVTSPGL